MKLLPNVSCNESSYFMEASSHIVLEWMAANNLLCKEETTAELQYKWLALT